jgi:hypothetical protein
LIKKEHNPINVNQINMSVKRDFPTPTVQQEVIKKNQLYVDFGETATEEEKRRFAMFNFLQKVYLYAPPSRVDASGKSIMGCSTPPDKIKWSYFQQGILYHFTTMGSPPFRMYLQLAQMFPNYRFYTKCEGFSDCAYHGRETFYFGERGNTRDCTMGVGHYGEGCTRRDRTVLPFNYPVKK